MLWFRWTVGFVLLTSSVWLIGLNGMVFWKRHIKREQTSSWIPILGGVLGAAALALFPPYTMHRWWWMPLLLDWGSLPGIAYSIVWHIAKAKQEAD